MKKEAVAQDREKPRLHAAAGLKLVQVAQDGRDGILNEVIREIPVTVNEMERAFSILGAVFTSS